MTVSRRSRHRIALWVYQRIVFIAGRAMENPAAPEVTVSDYPQKYGGGDASMWPEYCNPSYVMPDIIEVKVVTGAGRDREIYFFPVQILKASAESKAYLGSSVLFLSLPFLSLPPFPTAIPHSVYDMLLQEDSGTNRMERYITMQTHKHL